MFQTAANANVLTREECGGLLPISWVSIADLEYKMYSGQFKVLFWLQANHYGLRDG